MPSGRQKRRGPRNRPEYTAGGLPGFAQDLGRHALGVGDLAASILLETVNMVPRGLAITEAVTPVRKLGPNANFPILDPTKDDVSGYAETAPQFPNPFPMSEVGQQKAVSIGRWLEDKLSSDTGQKMMAGLDTAEQFANETLGPEIPGALFSILTAGLEVAGPKGKKGLTRLPKQKRVKLEVLQEKYPEIRPILKNLTVEEKMKVTGQYVNGLLKTWEQLDPSEMASVALAGAAKKGWYKKSVEALNLLFGDEDAPRFAGLLAAMSPQTSVESNLKNALNTWLNWDKAGRPRDAESIFEIMARSVEGEKGADSVLGAWAHNSVDALSIEDISMLDLSGAKVDSFMRNLWGDFFEVTNDTWIAKYTGLKQKNFSSGRSKNKKGEVIKGKKTAVYMGINAATRKAAELLSRRTGEVWTPAEIQETVWSWAKAISEKADNQSTPITELITELTNAEVNSVPDFGALLSQPGQFRDILSKGGVDVQKLQQLEALAARSGATAIDPSGAVTGRAGIQPRHLDAAAERLEGARRAERRPPALESLRQSIERGIAGESAPAYRRRDRPNRKGFVATEYSLSPDRIDTFNSLGMSTPIVGELRASNPKAVNQFVRNITAAHDSTPAGAQVYIYSPEEYAGMRLFQTPDGKAGFALKGDDIVSVFNHDKSPYDWVTADLIGLAIEQGGRRLDAFDTYLPHLYKKLGFQEVSRSPWNERYKPPNWDKQYFRKYNNGEPDVVYMEYRPTQKLIEEMTKNADPLQQRLAGTLKQPLTPASPTGVPEQQIDLSRFDERLRNTLR